MSYSSEKVINWRRRTKQKIIDAMGGGCLICSYNRCQNALELHHLDPSKKELGFAGVRANPKAMETLIPELRKCVLLCSNCHKEVHAGYVQVPTLVPVLDEEYLVSELELKRRRKRILENETNGKSPHC